MMSPWSPGKIELGLKLQGYLMVLRAMQAQDEETMTDDIAQRRRHNQMLIDRVQGVPAVETGAASENDPNAPAPTGDVGTDDDLTFLKLARADAPLYQKSMPGTWYLLSRLLAIVDTLNSRLADMAERRELVICDSCGTVCRHDQCHCTEPGGNPEHQKLEPYADWLYRELHTQKNRAEAAEQALRQPPQPTGDVGELVERIEDILCGFKFDAGWASPWVEGIRINSAGAARLAKEIVAALTGAGEDNK